MGTLIQAAELGRRLDEPALRVFDCRFDLMSPEAGRQAYAVRHIRGAAYADLNRDLSSLQTPGRGRHPLPAPSVFAARLRAFGVSTDSVVVAYDAGNSMFAARLWWMLRWLGHDEAYVLDGGWQRWAELGLPVDSATPAYTPGNFVAHPRPEMVVEAERMLAAIGDRDVRVLDARAPERYRGDVEPIDPVAGHVPGARNHPFTTSVGADGRFLSSDELRAAFQRSLGGVPPDKTITMCGSGVTACHLLLAMEHAGLDGARLYPGSWSEWSRDPARPVARGAEP